MLNNKIKWGILGSSFISEVMANAIKESTEGELFAIGSRSLITAEDFAEKFHVPKIYNDYQALLEDPEIQIVYIALPNHVHKEWIILAAKMGKHILCEKPLVMNKEEMKEVIAAVKKYNVLCMEALMYRHHPFIIKLQELINDQCIGEVKLITATYNAHIADIVNPLSGGSIYNLGCYPISLVRLFAQAEPIDIVGVGQMDSANHDTQASTILTFENGINAVISTSDSLDMSWQFDVYGTKGNLKIISNPWLPTQDDNKAIIYRKGQEPIEINVTADKPLYTYQINTMNNNVLNGNILQADGISLQDSLGNVHVLESWFKQVKNNYLIA